MFDDKKAAMVGILDKKSLNLFLGEQKAASKRASPRLKFMKADMPLYPSSKLYACQTIFGGEDFRIATAEVNKNTKDPKKLETRNLWRRF